MTQQVGYFFKISPVLDQVTGQGVAQEMSSGTWHFYAGSAQAAPDYLADRPAVHGASGLMQEKNLSAAASRTTGAQIPRDGLANLA